MIPERIAIKGFLSYGTQEQAIAFDGASLWLLAGPNGSGKSSVFDAMTFALFGAYRGGKQDFHEAINKDCDGGAVTFDFHLDGAQYQIRRTLKRKKGGGATAGQHVAQWTAGAWVPVADASKKADFDKWVREHIGLSYESFTASVLLVQGKADALLAADPRERHDVLARIIGMESYERLYARAAEKARGFETEARVLQTQLDGYPEVTDEALHASEDGIATAEQALKDANAEVQRLDMLVKEGESIASAYQLLKTLHEQRTRLRTAREKAATALDQEAAAVAAAQQHAAKLQVIEAPLTEARAGLEALRDQQTEKQTLFKELRSCRERFFSVVGHQRCRYCGQELTPGHIEAEQGKLEDELARAQAVAAQAETAYRHAREAKERLEKEAKDLVVLRDRASEEAGNCRRIHDQMVAAADGASLACTAAYHGLPERFRSQVGATLPADMLATVFPTDDELREVADAVARATNGQASDIRHLLAQAQATATEWKKKVIEATTARQRLLDRQEERKKLTERRATAVRQGGLHGLLADCLGRDKLQRHVMRQAEQRIVDYAAGILLRLSENTLSLRQKTEEPTGSDKALVLEVVNPFRADHWARPVEMLSGSERFRVAVSLALAIGQYASRQQRPIQSVIIDEGFGCLDPDNRRWMIDELQRLQGQLARIILVSHQEEFASAFPNRYCFRLEPGGTRVALHRE